MLKAPRLAGDDELSASVPSGRPRTCRRRCGDDVNDDRPPLLEVRGLTTEFVSQRTGVRRAVRAVDDVSFEIARGEILALAGESGSGKSVTALSILRLVPPPGRIVSGSIRFEGRDLLTLDEPVICCACAGRGSASCSRNR